jgi:PQQ-like domain
VCTWDVNQGSVIWKTKTDGQVHGHAVGGGIVALGRRDGGVRLLRLEDG